MAVDQQANGLATSLPPITNDPDLWTAMREGDAADRLLAALVQ